MADKTLSHPQGWLTRTPINRVSFTVLPRQGVEFPFLGAAISKGEGQLSHLLQAVRRKGELLSLTAA